MSTIISLNGSDWTFKGYIGEDWLWRGAVKADTRDTRGWQPASVPGSVQTDLWQAGLIPDPYFEMNSLSIEWVPERTWLYRKAFFIEPELRGKRVQLVFEGVDYAARYYLNGEMIGQSTGMYLSAVFDVEKQLHYGEENLLVVVIDPAPFEQPQIGYTSQVYTQKARMNYWWDFCPRMVHLGIWKSVYFRVASEARIEDMVVRPALSVDLLSADVNLLVEIDSSNIRDAKRSLRVEAVLRKAGGGVELARKRLVHGKKGWAVTFPVDQPDLWWTNGAGAQPLYEIEVSVMLGEELSDFRVVNFGIRRIEFVHNEGAADGTLPYNLVVNGRKQYIKGWNWVPADVLYGSLRPEQYEHLLRLAQSAHVNMLRVWGGGLIEQELFYNLCDQMGILVWQEFIQSSSGIDNIPSEDTQFIQFLVHNAEAAVRARRNHPSLAVWCGGNELHYAQDRLCDDSHPALAALKETVQRLDPDRHWMATSPAGGVFGYQIPGENVPVHQLQDVHGPWEYQGLRKQYTLYNHAQSLLHSEFGVEGITNRRALNRTISPERQWPVSLNNPVWEHLGAWWVKEKVWQEVLGPLPDLASALRATQFLQAEGLRYALEADRRRAFYNGGTMPWQFNEPFPMAACTSAVDYYGEPKPVYYAVRRAYQDFSITARFDTLAWRSSGPAVQGSVTGELAGVPAFSAEIWCSNFEEARTGSLKARLVEMDGRVIHEETWSLSCGSLEKGEVGKVAFPLEQIEGSLFLLDLVYQDLDGETQINSRYLFSAEENFSSLVSLQPVQPHVQIRRAEESWQVELHNATPQVMLGIWLEADKNDLRAPGAAYFEDNDFSLLPGETRVVMVEWAEIPVEERAIKVSGWSAASA